MRDYRKAFPFTIGTTSYILPVEEDNLIKNAEFLSKKVDKIQLLFFGKDYLNEMLKLKILERLQDIRRETGVTYSVHLPLDLGFLETQSIEEGLSILSRIFRETENLEISNFILHIDPLKQFEPGNKTDLEIYRKPFEKALKGIQAAFPELVSRIDIENTSYDLSAFADVIGNFDFPVCMDIGHLHLLGLPLEGFLKNFGDRIHEVHLHGFRDRKDHQGLEIIDPLSMKEILGFLDRYNRSVIIEVFNEHDLNSSLDILKKHYSI